MEEVMEPEEQFDHAIQLLKVAFGKKSNTMDEKYGHMKQMLVEKDGLCDELNRTITRLELDLQESNHKQKIMLEENGKLLNENAALTQEIRQLKKELQRLSQFKKAIINTIDDDVKDKLPFDLAFDTPMRNSASHHSAGNTSNLQRNGLSPSSSANRRASTPLRGSASTDHSLEYNPRIYLEGEIDPIKLINQIDRSLAASKIQSPKT